MALTSTIPTVKRQIVDLLTVALSTEGTNSTGVPVYYAWPGAETEAECVFLGPHPGAADLRIDSTHDDPTIKSGRQRRQEQYTVRVTVWSFMPNETAADAEVCESRAFDIAGHVEDVLANDPHLGFGDAGVVQSARVVSLNSTLFPFQKGWACELSVDVEVRSCLT